VVPAFSGAISAAAGLYETLKDLDGVMTVHQEEDLFYIGCSRDMTADIARVIVGSGVGLNYLHRKEYGLDDIYNRYFEGGERHE
jgi:ABC-2 type transport system ATP-binding protein